MPSEEITAIKPRKRVGIMGGSYNPIHVAHTMIASYIAQKGGLDEVWLMVSPLNPLKALTTDLAPDEERYRMVEIACKDSKQLRASRFEFELPRPNYTVDTLEALRKAYPEKEFSLIIGSDNWMMFDRWRDGDKILANHNIIIYPRPGDKIDRAGLPENVRVVDAPELELSSTFIRRAIAEGLDMNYFVAPGVYDYIKTKKLYGAR